MSTQFIIAVTSSLTTAALLALLRIVIKARNSVVQLIDEHDFLMQAMRVVLARLQIEFPEPKHRK